VEKVKSHYQILIIGGGQAGLSVSARLLAKNSALEIGIVEPSERHYYQPGLTLVGGGVFTLNQIIRSEADFIPSKVTWIKDSAEKFDPDNNLVALKSGGRVTYDFMVVCCGIQVNWDHIKGLQETLGKNGVCSNYHFDMAPYTYQCLKDFKGGKAIFTQPASLIKCGAAPQKIMYLTADNFRRRGLLEKADISFYTGKPGLLRVKEINAALLKIAGRYGINLFFQSNIVEVRGDAREAVFEIKKDDATEVVTVNYEMLHVAPLQSAPNVIKNSPLAVPEDPQGWVDVDMYNFQHKRYGNVFSLGDVASLGDTKTGAAVYKQAPLVVNNLLATMDKKPIDDVTKYMGYTACPLTTGYGKLLLAEFDHENNLTPTFPLDPTKERYSYWLMIKYGMPWMYWNRILKGKA
jgi:sulfide:quinone oxidoreductase